MATWGELAYQQYAVRSDGQKYRDGQRNDNLDTSFVSFEAGLLELGAGIYDELLVARGLVTAERLESWYRQRSPFFDPSPAIDASAQAISTLDNQVRIDEQGVRVRKAGEVEDTALMNQDGFHVYDTDGTRLLTLGEIAGLPGVPSGVSHGLQGVLGTGVFIEGAPRLIDAGATFGYAVPIDQNPTAGTSDVKNINAVIIPGTSSVPEGKKWLLVLYLVDLYADWSSAILQYRIASDFGSGLVGPDEVTDASMYITVYVHYTKTDSSGSFKYLHVKVNWIVLEVDA